MTNIENLLWMLLLVTIFVMVGIAFLAVRMTRMETRVDNSNERQAEQLAGLQAVGNRAREDQIRSIGDMQQKLEQRFGELQSSIEKRLGETANLQIERLSKSNEQIQETLHKRLHEISGQVEQRLAKGFERTNETFTDVIKRLALIDEAQKRITELSSNVVSLQEVLTDKRSRGAFGEAQMMLQVRNTLPENSFREQHTLPNGARVDCMLLLPEPTGNLCIDAKFPLDSYKTMMDNDLPESDRMQAQRQFKLDIKKHVRDIAEKYIIPGETSDGALMFIPAEAVFAEIHAHHGDLVDEAQQRRVWMVSPTTMMAVLTTARAVLKDSATRKQVHQIQEHLVRLATDFDRFTARMENLSKHIRQANKDVDDVNISAKKISSRFTKIEQVELEDEEDLELLEKET